MTHGKQSALFISDWTNALGIPESAWRDAVESHLKERPFANAEGLFPYFEALFTEVPEIVEARSGELTRSVADTYGRFCLAIWNAGSLYPAFSENYAEFLLGCLRNGEALPTAALTLAQVYRPNTKGSTRCGFNQLAPENREPVHQSERALESGHHELFLSESGRAKYEEYLSALESSEIFQKDWQAIVATCPEASQAGILRRSLIPERNWIRGNGASFDDSPNTFQAIFDLFCWKWFLYGMADGEPLLQKPSVNVTPMGTQIFIPGYMSLDPKRDLDFRKINELHRARGIRNQGKVFQQARQKRRELAKRARTAEEEARSKGLKGEVLYSFIAEAVGKPDADPATVRKWLKTEPR